MDMQMFAALDGLHNFADVSAVLDDGIAHSKILQGNLVADRNIAQRFKVDALVAVHNPTVKLIAFLHPFDNDNADAIAGFVNHKMGYHTVLLE